MKYRIKDPDVVKAFKILGWTYEFDETEVERFGFYWHGNFRGKIYFNPHEEFEVEPVPEHEETGREMWQRARRLSIQAVNKLIQEKIAETANASESEREGIEKEISILKQYRDQELR